MIDLTPIDERIQKRLFQKMDLLGKKVPNQSSDGFTFQQLANKTTFIRMTSGLEEPVVLMGGELIETADKNFNIQRNTAQGYDEIYGPKNYISYDTDDNFKILGENKFKRPMPGVKSIDVNFKGGVRALREATISWTCWSFDDINRLSPHFLSHGKTVMLEWGWVYDKNTLMNLPRLFGSNGIKKDVYTNYQDYVQGKNGDFDFMVGIVKNFEYTTREDGAFDCQTILTSVGASIFDNITPNKRSENTAVRTKLTKKQEVRVLRELVTDSPDTDILTFDTGVTLKLFMRRLVRYISQDREKRELEPTRFGNKTKNRGTVGTTDSKSGNLFVRPNAYIYESNDFAFENAWVRWGWFEDNILSKFLTLVPKNTDESSIAEFRSVEKINDDEFESVKIRSHERLETVNINKYILPGKLKTFDGNIEGLDSDSFSGDSAKIRKLGELVNNEDNFKPFDTDDGKGYLRNMLVNVKVLTQAFGVESEFNTEPLNLREAFNSIFLSLNEPLPFWSLELTQDTEQTYRTKIIDTQITAIDFTNNKKINQKNNGDIGTRSIFDGKEVRNNGVFFFPVWRTDSIVKSQNITAKVPDALAISIMYGANYDDIKSLDNPPPEASSLEGVALGGLLKTKPDTKLDDMDIALRKSEYEKIGFDETKDSLKKLNSKGSSDNLKSFLESLEGTLGKEYQERLESLNTEINGEALAETEAELNKLINPSITYPLPTELQDEKKEVWEKLYSDGNYRKIYQSKFHDTGEMKQLFIDSISDSISLQSNVINSSESTKPLLIPLDLELEIEGIGGILPSNSFHSTYLPRRYQQETLFQIFDVGHKVDSSGWSVTISGAMRSTLSKMTNTKQKDEFKTQLDAILKSITAQKQINNLEDIKLDVKLAKYGVPEPLRNITTGTRKLFRKYFGE